MPIQTTDNKALVDYFKSNYPKAWYSKFTSPVETAKFELGYQGIKASLSTPVSWLLDPFRYDYAIWKWLRPNEPTMGIKELSALQKEAALTHVELSAFRAALYNRCRDKLREQEQFKLWISKRMALLEYLLYPPISGPSSLADVCPAYRLALMQAQALFCLGDYPKALDIAEEIGRKALIAAGQSAVTVLFDGQIDFQANLMLPASSPAFDFYETCSKNAAASATLWQPAPETSKYLVIVDETSSGEHVGFWVPCCPGEKHLYLPGAPRAFMTTESSSVYKDDLPPLYGFSDKLGSSWQAYITNNLKEDMFVSIPLVVLSEEHTAGKQSVAVMNLNVKGRDQSSLSRRAYHQEWLLVAAERAKPFLEVSYWCTVIKLNASKMVDRKNYLDLETGLIDWNGIPGIELKEMDG